MADDYEEIEESNENSESNETQNSDQFEDEEEIIESEDLEEDIREVISDESQTQYSNVVQTTTNPVSDADSDEEEINFNFQEEYDLQTNQIIKDLNINLGSSDLPRYQCANHKLDIVGRKAVKLHRELREIARKLNRSNARCRRVIKLSRVFRQKKCRLRLESKTRWSPFYLLLLSTKKAYDKGAFDQSDPEKSCPVSLETIETYLQILKPLYLLNVSFQSDHSTIADVIPGIEHSIRLYLLKFREIQKQKTLFYL